MDYIIRLFKALSEEKRLRILLLLTKGELCTCQLSELLSLTESTISTHMAILKQCNLIETRKSGKWVYYSLPKLQDNDLVTLFGLIQKKSADNDTVKNDLKQLKEVKTCRTK